MKKYQINSLFMLFLLPLALMAQDKNTYILEGKTEKNASVTVQYSINGKLFKNNAEVTNGLFKLTGTISSPVEANLLIVPIEKGQLSTMVHLWMEPGNIHVYNLDSIPKKDVVFAGSKTNDESNELRKAIMVTESIKDADKQTEVRKEITLKFIKSHPNSMVSLAELTYNFSRGVPDIALVEPLFNQLSDGIKNSPMGKAYQQKLDKWKKVDVGSPAPDFMQPDQQGKPVKLSDFRGKYVLIDFWASWCHPCRDENPNLIRQFNLYKNKGFTILSVSIDGGGFGTKAAWLKAIAHDNVGSWTHVCDFVGANNKVRAQYGVGSIPESFLVDPNGNIIAKSLRGEALNQQLKEIFENAPPMVPDTADNQLPIYQPKQQLPLDTAVRFGKLKNGFTYYIRKNTTPKNRVLFYLANKVGSILEDDDQRGLAHFMEHMNFNGTTHFPKNDLVNYLQKSGVRFGADLNAYTGFDETVYQLPLPSDNPEILDKGIQIMRDWANSAVLDPQEINRERGVILEEKRIGKGAGERMRNKYLPILLNHSRYAERLPIGIESVLNHFKPAVLERFYKEWYRPDLQCLIVVGDIDVDKMEVAVRSKFQDLVNPKNPRIREAYSVPLTGKNQFIAVTDQEQGRITMEVLMKHKGSKLLNEEDYRQYILKALFNSIMENRITDLFINKVDAPINQGSTAITDINGGLNGYSVSFWAKPEEIEKGFKSMWIETERVKRFGVTQTELDRAKSSFLSRLESNLLEKDKTNSEQFVNEYLMNFLKQTAAPGLQEEFDLTKMLLKTITVNDLHGLAESYIKDTDRDIVILAPEKDSSLLPDKHKVEVWMNEVEHQHILPYKDMYAEKPLLSQQPVPGKIVSEKFMSAINATALTLSNGAKVILKKTDFSNNFILFDAFAPGGSSLYPDTDYQSANYAAYFIDQAGIGNYKFTDLKKFLSGKDIFTSTNIRDYIMEIQGGFAPKDMETFFAVNYAKFTQPVYDKEAFDATMSKLKSSLLSQNNTPESLFDDSLSVILKGNNIRGTSLNSDKLKQIELDKTFRIYQELFANASNFTFVFSGPIDEEKIKPFIEKYIASLPSLGEAKSKAHDLGIHPPDGEIKKEIYKGKEEKAKVNLVFSGTYDFNVANNVLMDALNEIIQINLIKRLRIEESGVYAPSTSVSYHKIPDERYIFKISFDCAPENTDRLINATLDEIKKLKMNGPDNESIEKFKAEDQSNHTLNLKSDFYWLQYIQQQIVNQGDFNEVNEYNKILENVTKESVKRAAGLYLNGKNLIYLILKPEQPGLDN